MNESSVAIGVLIILVLTLGIMYFFERIRYEECNKNRNSWRIKYKNLLALTKSDEEVIIDLFLEQESLPQNVQDVINKWVNKVNDFQVGYEECAFFLDEMIAVGYTFECGLDSVPFNLQKL